MAKPGKALGVGISADEEGRGGNQGEAEGIEEGRGGEEDEGAEGREGEEGLF